MASIGLRVVDSSSNPLSLADTLAKGVFGDPEAQAKAALIGAQIRAHDAYVSKLGADTSLVNVKTKEEQALADAQDAAAAHPDALIAAIPSPARPIPVEAPRANAPGTTGYGPQPGIVTPDAQATYDAGVKMHDAQAATLRAAWPAIVRSGNATQIIEALGKGEGLAALSGGLVPGAKPDPNVQRVAGGLYTGTAPSTTTVWSPGDTAGVNAAAAADITKERDKPIIKDVGGGLVTVNPATNIATPVTGAEPQPAAPTIRDVGGVPYVVHPDGSMTPATGITPQPTLRDVNGGIVRIDPATGQATPVPGAEPKPEKPNIQMVGDTPYIVHPDGSLTPAQGVPQGAPKLVEASPDKANLVWNPKTQTYEPAPGVPQPGPPAAGPYGGLKSAEGVNLQQLVDVARKFADPNAIISSDEARAYAVAYNDKFGTKIEYIENALGQKIPVPMQTSPPQGQPSPAEVFARAGVKMSGPTPPADNQAPPVASSAPPVATPPSATAPAAPAAPAASASLNVARPPTQEQTQLQQYTPLLVSSTGRLDKITPAEIPGVMMQQLMGIRGNDPNLLQSWIASVGATPQQRAFGQAVAEYNQSLLYMLSGKAITDDEYKRALNSYIPQPNDDQALLDWKAEQRHSIIASAVRLGWSNDPATAETVLDNIKARGIDLRALDLTRKAAAPPAAPLNAPNGKPPISSFFK